MTTHYLCLSDACQLEINLNTAHRNLKLSGDGRKVTVEREEQPYPDHPERFEHCCWQLMCKNELTGRCYWGVERVGSVTIATKGSAGKETVPTAGLGLGSGRTIPQCLCVSC